MYNSITETLIFNILDKKNKITQDNKLKYDYLKRYIVSVELLEKDLFRQLGSFDSFHVEKIFNMIRKGEILVLKTDESNDSSRESINNSIQNSYLCFSGMVRQNDGSLKLVTYINLTNILEYSYLQDRIAGVKIARSKHALVRFHIAEITYELTSKGLRNKNENFHNIFPNFIKEMTQIFLQCISRVICDRLQMGKTNETYFKFLFLSACFYLEAHWGIPKKDAIQMASTINILKTVIIDNLIYMEIESEIGSKEIDGIYPIHRYCEILRKEFGAESAFPIIKDSNLQPEILLGIWSKAFSESVSKFSFEQSISFLAMVISSKYSGGYTTDVFMKKFVEQSVSLTKVINGFLQDK